MDFPPAPLCPAGNRGRGKTHRPIDSRRGQRGASRLKLTSVTSPSHHLLMQDRALTRGQARRLSRRFGDVGVAIPATRLRQIAAGASARDDELTDVSFAIAATLMQEEQRLAKLKRHQRRVVRWLIVAGLVLLLLNSLMCMAYLFFSMTLHAYAY